MMVTYTLQSYDKGIMSAASQFNFNEDLGLTTVIGHQADGKAITDDHRYSNASMMFYIGYLVGTYPMMYLSHHRTFGSDYIDRQGRRVRTRVGG